MKDMKVHLSAVRWALALYNSLSSPFLKKDDVDEEHLVFYKYSCPLVCLKLLSGIIGVKKENQTHTGNSKS